jgi:hypothetical protein
VVEIASLLTMHRPQSPQYLSLHRAKSILQIVLLHAGDTREVVRFKLQLFSICSSASRSQRQLHAVPYDAPVMTTGLPLHLRSMLSNQAQA